MRSKNSPPYSQTTNRMLFWAIRIHSISSDPISRRVSYSPTHASASQVGSFVHFFGIKFSIHILCVLRALPIASSLNNSNSIKWKVQTIRFHVMYPCSYPSEPNVSLGNPLLPLGMTARLSTNLLYKAASTVDPSKEINVQFLNSANTHNRLKDNFPDKGTWRKLALSLPPKIMKR
jgi:hypothetical protein